jgi:Mn-containing catalase
LRCSNCFSARVSPSDTLASDLALIGAAQKVEHYEIDGYTTARNLAQQLKMPALVQLLQLTLAEEENADQLLNQVARPLMSAARMPLVVESAGNGGVAASK